MGLYIQKDHFVLTLMFCLLICLIVGELRELCCKKLLMIVKIIKIQDHI